MPHDPRTVLDRSAARPDLVLRWASVATHGADGLADVYLPGLAGSAVPAGVVIALHGGFWRRAFDRRHLRPLAIALRDTGRVVVVPEYRRPTPAGGWRVILDDVRALRAELMPLLTDTVPDQVDSVPPILLGHSAGGQLAIWWALEATGSPDRPSRVVALAPVADLVRAHADDLGGGAVRNLFGGEPSQQPGATAMLDVAARLRAGERVGRLVVVHGAEDRQVPVEHSAALARDVGSVDLQILPGIEHFGLIDPLGPAWPQVLGTLGSSRRR